MAINLPDLSTEDQQALSELATNSQDETLRQAVNSYLERAAQLEEEDDELDLACIQWCAEQLQGQAPPSLEEVRQELSTIKSSLAAEIITERDES
jgi:nucleoid-associated protein YejK